MSIRKLLAAGVISAGLVGSVASAAGVAMASTSHHVSTARTTAAHVKAGESSGENSGGQEGSTQGDGPGGHADQAGQNVDHQFTGVE